MSDWKYSVHRRLLREALGLSERLPADFEGTFTDVTVPSTDAYADKREDENGKLLREPIPGTWTVKIYPQTGRYSRSHRVMIVCKCGREIPTGRLHQHRGVCQL